MSERRPMKMKELLILRIGAKFLIPFILLFALYVQFHGDFGPGGGFQAGVIFAAGLILYGLVFGLDAMQQAVPQRAMEIGMAAGVLLYGGTGVLALLLGGNFLDYDALDALHLLHGQHLGIILVEAGVGIAVTCTMVTLYYMFAGREQR